MADLFKFTGSGASVQRFESDDGVWRPDRLHRNQTISADPVTLDVTITSTFKTFIQVETFSQTPDPTDDDSLYLRTSQVFTAIDGAILPTDPRDGSHDDRLTGTGGKDRLDGGLGNDHLDGGDGNDKLGGGEGDDDLLGGSGKDTIDGGAGLDVISGDDGADQLGGSADDDVVSGGDGDDKIDGGTGDDLLDGGIGKDAIKGGAGDDDLTGGDGDDVLSGGDGNDTLLGGAGEDKLDGGKGNDVFLAGQDPGQDKMVGGAGEDLIDYSTSTSRWYVNLATGVSHPSSDVPSEWQETDKKISGIEDVRGSAGDDIISGSKSANKLDGGAGDDSILALEGRDTLTGGAGHDTFIYGLAKESPLAAPDVITDFTSGEDTIDLWNVDTIKALIGSPFTLSDTAPIDGKGACVIWFDAAAHTLYLSTDNDATAEMAIVLVGVDAITVDDLRL